jgi:cytochrome c biogenesis protein CcmG, thiol:disulfide interchange protein DsbE
VVSQEVESLASLLAILKWTGTIFSMEDTQTAGGQGWSMRRQWVFFSTLALILAAAWIWFSRVDTVAARSGRPPAPHPGFAAPDFSLPTRDGDALLLSDLQGQVVIINVWATWCPPCRAEMPAMQKVYVDYAGQGLEIVAINATYSDNPAKAIEFADSLGLTFPIVFDQTGGTANQYRVHSLPTTFFIDRQGIVQEVVVGGPLSEAMLRIRIEQLLNRGEGD